MELADRRNRAFNALRADLDGIAAGEGPSRFAAGHGLQSRVFRFEWREPSLEIDFALPFARLLSDAESQREDDAELCASIRMALLLLAAAEAGSLLEDGESRLRVSHDGRRAVWSALGPDGAPVCRNGDWDTLIARLEAVLPRDEREMTVFLP